MGLVGVQRTTDSGLAHKPMRIGFKERDRGEMRNQQNRDREREGTVGIKRKKEGSGRKRRRGEDKTQHSQLMTL